MVIFLIRSKYRIKYYEISNGIWIYGSSVNNSLLMVLIKRVTVVQRMIRCIQNSDRLKNSFEKKTKGTLTKYYLQKKG